MSDILLVSQNELNGFVPDGFPNMRTEYCWAKIMNAWMTYYEICSQYPADIAFFILPKDDRKYDNFPLKYRNLYPTAKICLIQEGPIDYWMNWDIENQWNYLELLDKVDGICVHNNCDVDYIHGLGIPLRKIYQFPTLYDPDLVPDIFKLEHRSGVIIAGNCSKWYGGMYPLRLLLKLREKGKFAERICMMGTGRRTTKEKEWLNNRGVECLDWWNIKTWMQILNTFRLGINLMPTCAAGSFNLNCATLMIPCIGFNDIDTQRRCHHHELWVPTDFHTDPGDALYNIDQLISNMVTLDSADFYGERIPYPECWAETYSIQHEISIEEYGKHIKNILDS